MPNKRLPLTEKDYPAEWKSISNHLKERAGWRCTKCGRAHNPGTGYTLTVHHIDGNPYNVDHDNLAVLCQRCHLRAQAFPDILNANQLVMAWGEVSPSLQAGSQFSATPTIQGERTTK